MEFLPSSKFEAKFVFDLEDNRIKYNLNGKPAAVCPVPVATPGWHHWNFAQIGTITFPEPGIQVLTFHYGWGNNFAYFLFEPVCK